MLKLDFWFDSVLFLCLSAFKELVNKVGRILIAL